MPPSSLSPSRVPVLSRLREVPDIDVGIGLELGAESEARPRGESCHAVASASEEPKPEPAARTASRASRRRREGPGALPFLLATGAMLGSSTALAKLAATAGLPPLAFLAWSCGGAAVLSLARAAFRGTLSAPGARTAEYCLWAAFLTVAAPNLILFSAVVHVGAAFVATTIALPALLTYLGALAFGLERFRARRVAGVALALGGTANIALLEIAVPHAPVGWIAFVLVAPLLFAGGNLYRTLRWPAGLAPETLVPGMLVAATAMLFAASLAPLPELSVALPLDRPLPVLLIGVQALVFTAQFLFLLELQRRGGPVYLSLVGPVGALVGIPAAVLLLGESAPRGLGAGAFSIALGVGLLSARRGGRRRGRSADVRTVEEAAGGEVGRRRRRRRRRRSSLGAFATRGALGRRWRRGAMSGASAAGARRATGEGR